jgi:hypothetical protein
MNTRFSNCEPPGEEPDDRTQSNYSTERSPVTELLHAGKEAVILPLIEPNEGETKTEALIQE